jgi:hypothetical protein
MLRHNQVEPILVFDGQNLPSKGVTEDDRAQCVCVTSSGAFYKS